MITLVNRIIYCFAVIAVIAVAGVVILPVSQEVGTSMLEVAVVSALTLLPVSVLAVTVDMLHRM